jgi:hypothetical protein
MTDLGYGFIDRRTVVVILITLVVAGAVFGFSFPFTTTTLFSLFVDLVFFTGYLYAARTMFRSPRVLWSGTLSWKRHRKQAGNLNWRWWIQETINETRWDGLWGFIDRLWLIAITVLSTIPVYGQEIMRTVGLVGLLLMLAIYLFRGNFSFALEDTLKKTEEDQERLIEAVKKQPESRPSIKSSLY